MTSDKNEMKFIAPLDNLLWDRAMIKSIFGLITAGRQNQNVLFNHFSLIYRNFPTLP